VDSGCPKNLSEKSDPWFAAERPQGVERAFRHAVAGGPFRAPLSQAVFPIQTPHLVRRNGPRPASARQTPRRAAPQAVPLVAEFAVAAETADRVLRQEKLHHCLSGRKEIHLALISQSASGISDQMARANAGPQQLYAPHVTGSFLPAVADASAEDAATAGKGTARLARHAFWPRGTPATGIAVPGNEQLATAGAYIGHHLHLGPRTGSGSAAQLTKRVGLGGECEARCPQSKQVVGAGNGVKALSLLFSCHLIQCDPAIPLCSPVCPIAIKMGRLDRR
jgi:hypothetical protein